MLAEKGHFALRFVKSGGHMLFLPPLGVICS